MSHDVILEETRKDWVQVAKAVNETHVLLHGDEVAWADCELDPCHSICLFMGDVAVLIESRKRAG